MTTEEMIVKIQELGSKLKIARDSLNKIAILQMSELDYTQDFFEITKQLVRETLDKIK